MSEPGYRILSLDDLDRYPGEHGAQVLRPLRRRLGFRPFGINCWEARSVGENVIEPHREPDGDEELYIVLRGRATFTVGETTVAAPAGTLIHVPAGTFRTAIAEEPDTLVLAAGARIGEAWSPAPWEDFHVAFALARAGELGAARELIDATIEAHPGAWQGPYNAACFEARYGDADLVFAHLDEAVALSSDTARTYAAGDADFAGLHSDPRWGNLIGTGAPEPQDTGSAGSETPPAAGDGQTAHVDELDRIEMPDGFVWHPVRRRFGIRAFGVNAYSARAAGEQIVEEHSEEQLGHEEIYLVLRGRVRFTVAGNEHELGPLELVFVSDPRLRRGAVAVGEDALVLALGGKPGAPHEVSAWETMFAAVPAMQEERWDEAIRLHEEALAERPDHPALLYNLACMEARGGRSDDALRHLQRSVELEPKWAAEAAKDADFEAIRDAPGFPAS
jgi:quercetin dioxygenase-like cupin family protein